MILSIRDLYAHNTRDESVRKAPSQACASATQKGHPVVISLRVRPSVFVARREMGAQIRVHADAGCLLLVHRAVQPAIGIEHVRVFSPEVLVTMRRHRRQSTIIYSRVRDDTTHRLYAATDTMILVPLGTSNSLSIFPFSVRIGLESGSTSSLVAMRGMCGAVGWNRSPSYSPSRVG